MAKRQSHLKEVAIFKDEIVEAEPIVIAAANALLEWAPSRGQEGAEMRARAGRIKVDVQHLLWNDKIAEPISEMFDLAIDGGMTLPQMENVRRRIDAFSPKTVGALVVRDCLIQLALVGQGRIIAGMEFRSRNDVEAVQDLINYSFSKVAEDVADRMDAMSYRAIVALHAALTFYLIETARPRPRMLNYRFNQHMTTLTMAYRLYADAGRGDELRYENKIVHPAFSPRIGKALAA